MEKYNLNGVTIYLSDSIDSSKYNWIGQNEPLEDILTSFQVISENDYPLVPKIKGKPGVGKTTLVASIAKKLNLPLYIMQCSADTRPEDLLISPVLNEDNKIIYVASPLLTGIIKGGVVVIDEANRMPEKSWATLASLFDDRQSVSSLIIGQTINAHKDFRCAITINEDSSVYDIPDYIDNRLAPIITLSFPNKKDELNILKYHLPLTKDEVMELCVKYMQQLHEYNLPYSIRDAVNALKLVNRTIKGDETVNQLEYIFYKSFSKVVGKPIHAIKQELEDAKISIYDQYENIAEEFFDDGEFLNLFGEDDEEDDED